MMRIRFAPIAASRALWVAAVFAAAGGCEKPESFHLAGGVPSMGIQAGQGGTTGDDEGGAGGGTATGGRLGTGGLFGTGGLSGTGGRGSGGVSAYSGSAGNPGSAGAGVRGGAGGGSSAAGGQSAGGLGVGGIASGGGQGGGPAGGGPGTGAGGGAGGSCATCAPLSLSIECRNNAPTDSTAMNAEIWIADTSPQPVPLAQLRLRYYYVNEGGTIGLEVFDKSFKNPDGSGYRGALVTFTGTDGKLTAPPMDYTDITFTSAETLDATAAFYFKMSLHDPSHSKLDLTNDYSNGPTVISTCPHIVVYAADTIVAGIPPAP